MVLERFFFLRGGKQNVFNSRTTMTAQYFVLFIVALNSSKKEGCDGMFSHLEIAKTSAKPVLKLSVYLEEQA